MNYEKEAVPVAYSVRCNLKVCTLILRIFEGSL